jgi:penicillin-binding protein 1A
MRFIGWAVSSVAFLVLLGVLAVLGALAYFSRDLPDYSQLADYEPPVTTRLYAADGSLMAEYAVEHRLFLPIEAIPDHVVQAFVSAEDQHFYDHPGVDLLGIVRAAITNVRNIGSDRRLVGASTITQQVAKNFLLSNEVSFARKIREILLALRIEQTLSKDRILELYLNEIYLGRGSYGVAAAALNYFNRSLPELSMAEAAYLAGLPKAPNNYDPDTRPEAALARRNYVIDRMLEDGAITEAEAAAARAEPLEVYEPDETQTIAVDYFSEEVRRGLQDLYGNDALYGGGLTVRTTLDPRLQEIAERTLREGLVAYDRRHGWRGPVARLEAFDGWADRLAEVERPPGAGDWRLALVLEVTPEEARIGLADGDRGRLPMSELAWARPWRENQRRGPVPRRPADVVAVGDVVLVEPLAEAGGAPLAEVDGETAEPAYGLRQIPEVQGALVAMDPHTGRVMAMSGGYSFEMSEFNRATQALRQPGSAFKPFVYLAALEAGFTPSTIVLDSPLAVDLGPGQPLWRPSNYSNDFLGPTPMRVGLERSRNVMTVRLLMAVGLDPVQEIAEDFRIYEEMAPHYSMALGAGETTPLRLTTAYAMLANGGRRIEPTVIDRVQNRQGETVFRHDGRDCAVCAEADWSGQAAPNPPDDRQRIANAQATYQLVNMMEGVVQRGTAARLRALGIPLAGKTGTTSDYHDAWFVGFTPDLAVGVFVGFDNPRSLGSREAGSAVAVPIFGAFMGDALDGIEVPPFRIPSGVRLVRVDPESGLVADPGDNFIWEAYRPGTEPNAPRLEELPNTSFGESLPSAIQGTGGLY